MNQLLQAGLNVTAIGMGVVFVLLTLLVGVIRGMSALSRILENAFPAASAVSSAGPSGSGPATPSQQQLVGVISAAIAAHRRRR